MKRIFSILLITALLVALMPLMSTVAFAEEYATITSENGYGVRLREGPSKAYNPLGTFSVGSTVVVLQRGDEWSQLQIGDKVGWMMNKYLIFGVAGSTTGTTAGVANAVVVSDNGLRVWLRTTPGGTRLFLNSPGTKVTILEGNSKWCKISINGTIGYMMTKYLAFEKVEPVAYELKSATINYYYPVVGDTLVVELEPSNATVTYEWYVDGKLLGTEDTFEVLTRYANQTIKVKVTATGNYYGSAVDTVYPVQINKGIKSVALSQKVPVVGETLEAVIQPTSAEADYSWRVGGVQVSSEATYTPTEDDLGKLIQLKVTGINGFAGSAVCTADSVVVSDKVVQYVELSNRYPVVGEVLTAEIYPSSADVNITWYADGEAVGYTGSYKVNKRDLGKKIKVVAQGVTPYTGTVTDISHNVATSEITGVKLTESSPMLGEWLGAKLSPANGTAYYRWYIGEDTLIAEGESSSIKLESGSLLVPAEKLVGERIWVTAVGCGVYTGSVSSNKTGEVIDNKVITGVALDNITPVVGDTIHAVLSPKNEKDATYESKQTYVWYVDTEIKETHEPYYIVQLSDVDKRIRVKVVGANGYSGEAYSAYTGKVTLQGKIEQVYIYNASTDKLATSVSPEVGHTLHAGVSPVGANDFVTYEWYVGQNSVATGVNSLTILPEWADQYITVKAAGTSAYYNEGKTVFATTKKVVYRRPLRAALFIDAPEVSVAPSYSAVSLWKDSGYDDCTASVYWLDADTWNTAVLDPYGCFLPGKKYIAIVTIQPKDPNLTLFNADVGFVSDVAGAITNWTQEYNGSNVYAVSFAPTSKQSVTDYYIADLAAPIVGGELDTHCGNDQVAGNVTWSYTDDKYIACIELTPYYGYSLDGLKNNVFVVDGATKTEYTAGTNIIWATFEVPHEFAIQSDKDLVYLDGYNRRIVQCSAHLSNYMGKLENVKWEIVDAKVDGTSINNNGQLIIGMHEETERTLTVRATVSVNGKEYVAEKPIQIFSGADTDTALQVVFTKYNAEITRGGRGYFEAVVSNSSDGCTLFAIYEDGTSAPITDGWLYVPASMKDEHIIVKGISNEDHSVSCTMLITLTGEITEPSTSLEAPKVEFTKGYAFVKSGSTTTYEAKTVGTLNPDTVIYAIWPDGTKEVLKEGKLSIPATSDAKNVTVTAYSTDDPMLSASMNVMVVENDDIKFTKFFKKLERGRSYTFEALMADTTVCKLYALFDLGDGYEQLTDGKLIVDLLDRSPGVLIMAVCPDANNVYATMAADIYDARTIEFTKSVDKVSKGGYAYTFAAKATVFGETYNADIYANFGDGETKLSGGVLNVPADTTATNVEVIAKYTHTDGEEITISKNVIIGDKNYIEFVSGPTALEHGDEATYQAVAYIYDEIKDCDIYAIWPNGVEEKLDDGKLKVSETELCGTVTIKAVYDLGKPTEMSATRTVSIRPEVKVEFVAGMKTALKRNESAVYTANAIFKNTTKPATICADYGDGSGYVELINGKLDASMVVNANVSLKAVYQTVEPAYMTVAIKDLPTIKFTESTDKVEKGSTSTFKAVAVVDGAEYAVHAIYADGTKLTDGKLVIAEDEDSEQVTVKAEYKLDDETVLTSEKIVKIFDKAHIEFTVAPTYIVRGAEAAFAAEARIMGEGYKCELFYDLGDGYKALEGGKLSVAGGEAADSVSIKAVYAAAGLEETKTFAIKDPTVLAWKNVIDVVEHGKQYDFAATATLPDSSVEACDIYVNGIKLEGSEYTVSETETAAIKVKAMYGEEAIEKVLPLKVAPYIDLAVPAKIRVGDTGVITANVVFPNTTVAANVTVNAGQYANGKLTISDAEANTTISVTATYDGVPSVTKTLPAYAKPSIRFTKSVERIERDSSGTFEAFATVDGVEYPCKLTASGGMVSKELTDGVVKYADFNLWGWTSVIVTVKATYNDNGVNLTATCYVTLPGGFRSGYSLRDGGTREDDIMTLGLGEEAEPVVEEDVTEEIVTEEPAIEEETESIVIELAPETAEAEAEAEPETIVIVVDTTEPVVEEDVTEEIVTEEPAIEEETEELTGVVLSIKDTITGEVVEEIVIEDEEEAVEEKPSTNDREEQAAEEVTEEEDETLDALEGDDIGESAESESAIKISFTKRANKIKLGNYSTFEVAVAGSDQGVIWSLRLSEDVNGEPVSSIDQDGRVTIGLDEIAEKLIVVATSREDRSVRARWIVEVTDEEIVEEAVTEEVIEETTEEAATEESVTDEQAMEEAGLAEENNVPEETVEETETFEEELITVEEGSSLVDMF